MNKICDFKYTPFQHIRLDGKCFFLQEELFKELYSDSTMYVTIPEISKLLGKFSSSSHVLTFRPLRGICPCK